ncbi:MAG TPA: IS21-like element helper ATPase IstB [Sandaracinaceae bacterium LLY-WYZ-13_1]|nr:IS21-like element helper ATPase IstB [Sandaracinaceae bacterium LLY-WYZ-13_1]
MSSPEASLQLMLRTLKLPSFASNHEEIGAQAERHGWTFGQALRPLCELEPHDRRERRIGRLMKASGLPSDKTLATLDETKLPQKVRRQPPALCEGGIAERGENVLLFGLPGRGKSHVASAIGRELVLRGRSVLFTATRTIVEKLLVARRELELDRMLRRLDGFDVVVLDDIGYVQQDRDEMEVFFTLFAQRYERSVVITSNLVFSQWDRIFKDPMTTAAAIDRLVHHATILELTGPSHRSEEAKKRSPKRTREEDDAT